MKLRAIILECSRASITNRSPRNRVMSALRKMNYPNLYKAIKPIPMNQLMEEHFARPVCQLLARNTNKRINYRQGWMQGYFYLIIDSKEVGTICMPNTSHPRMFFIPKGKKEMAEIRSLDVLLEKLGLKDNPKKSGESSE